MFLIKAPVNLSGSNGPPWSNGTLWSNGPPWSNGPDHYMLNKTSDDMIFYAIKFLSDIKVF